MDSAREPTSIVSPSLRMVTREYAQPTAVPMAVARQRLMAQTGLQILAEQTKGRHAGMVFVADDLAAWLTGLLADAGRKKLSMLLLGSDQERALRSAATAAVRLTAEELRPDNCEQTEHLAQVISQVFSNPMPDTMLAGRTTLLETLQAAIARQLAVLDDGSLTDTQQSSTDVTGIPAGVLADRLFGHVVQEVITRGSRGGPLAPLADQINHDFTHLQGQRLEGMVGEALQALTLLAEGRAAPLPDARATAGKPPQPRTSHVNDTDRSNYISRGSIDLKLINAAKHSRLVCLAGEGGVGKSSLARNYAREVSGLSETMLLRADDDTHLEVTMYDALEKLGIEGTGLSRAAAIAKLRLILSGHPPNGCRIPLTVVIDNAVSWNQLEYLLPDDLDSTVLITSRMAIIPPGRGVNISIPSMNMSQAHQMAQNRLPDISSRQLEYLNCLRGRPIAIEHVCAVLKTKSTSERDGFLATLERNLIDTLDMAASGLGEPGLKATYRQIIGELSARAETADAVEVLKCVLACNRTGLSENVLRAYFRYLMEGAGKDRGLGDVAYETAQNLLERYQLITLIGTNEIFPSDRGVEIHHLTAEILYDLFSDSLLDARFKLLLAAKRVVEGYTRPCLDILDGKFFKAVPVPYEGFWRQLLEDTTKLAALIDEVYESRNPEDCLGVLHSVLRNFQF